MVVVRPLLAQVVLIGTPTTRMQRWLMGWFGIRGIGSLYYLLYALREGLAPDMAREVRQPSYELGRKRTLSRD